MPDKPATSYKGILKSTGIVGGAQVLQIIAGILKTKVIAIVLGTAGVGIIGLYQTMLDLVRNMTSAGINLSGVKDVAEAKRTGEPRAIAETVAVINRWALATGALGTLVVFFFCIPLSRYSFGDASYAAFIAILSVTVVFTSVSQAQSAILQGMQDYAKLAKANIALALAGLVVSVPLYLVFGRKGIVPSLILLSVSSFMITNWFVGSLKIKKQTGLTIGSTFRNGMKMAKLGLFMVINGFLANGTMILTKSFIAQKGGVDSVGLFQASWTISTAYIGIVLNAMLTDFFPRLSACNTEDERMNRLTNEQGEITMILGAPLLTVMMAFSQAVVYLLYSKSFAGSLTLLRWMIASSFVTLVYWPVGVIFLAKGKGLYSVALDLFGSICFVALGVIGWGRFGVVSFGISMFIRSLLSILVVLLLGRKVSGFGYGGDYAKLVLLLALPFSACFVLSLLGLPYVTPILNAVLTAAVAVLSLFMLKKRIPLKELLDKIPFSRRKTDL